MGFCIILSLMGFFLIIDSLFDVSRRLGIKIKRKYTRYFAPIGFLLILLGLYLVLANILRILSYT